jgi:hypothetical protein
MLRVRPHGKPIVFVSAPSVHVRPRHRWPDHRSATFAATAPISASSTRAPGVTELRTPRPTLPWQRVPKPTTIGRTPADTANQRAQFRRAPPAADDSGCLGAARALRVPPGWAFGHSCPGRRHPEIGGYGERRHLATGSPPTRLEWFADCVKTNFAGPRAERTVAGAVTDDDEGPRPGHGLTIPTLQPCAEGRLSTPTTRTQGAWARNCL